MGERGNNIRPVHGLNVSISYPLKGISEWLVGGAELGIGNYDYVTKEQDMRFSDGSGITTDVIYSSHVFNAAGFLRFILLKQGRAIPYLGTKAGCSNFFSEVIVEDPDDPFSCEVL